MHELLIKVTGMRLKSDFWPKCLHCGLREMDKYRHPIKAHTNFLQNN